MSTKFYKATLKILTIGLTVGAMGTTLCHGKPNNQVTAQNPLIEFTYIPPYGSSENLRGRVYIANPADYKVATYIFVEGSGWWTKPYFADPLTSIQSDSTWTCDITTGGGDIYATGISTFLLPNGTTPPQAAGLADLPISLDTICVANVSTVRYGKSILFSGYEWWIKASSGLVGPGPNYFSDNSENVWKDAQGYLHLKMTQRGGIWYCPEIICKNSFGHGKYAFHVESKVGILDKNVVLGLFTWDNSSAENHREVDIEFSRWGTTEDTNAQYVIQPWDQAGNRQRWIMPDWIDPSAHSFDWKADSIYFLSVKGDSIIHSWSYKGSSIPSHGNENARINLWLFNGVPPWDTSHVEAIITKFQYTGTAVGVQDNSGYNPSTFMFSENYPNPFNPVTTFEFSIPHSSEVRLTIYDILGKEVTTLISQSLNAGRYRTQWNASSLSSGIYFCRIQAGSFIESKKLVLVR